ncbi:hypothetical protein P5673_005779 [Acropora cervicornis]|uniref:Uncharacterized protein n=1 Tax=Acropora cervicornis TaxID=6130 RepID=A0AAD9QZD4_ACRCE|nr:hypothetical protein P5673_005779 [Acropora cervicornis]
MSEERVKIDGPILSKNSGSSRSHSHDSIVDNCDVRRTATVTIALWITAMSEERKKITTKTPRNDKNTAISHRREKSNFKKDEERTKRIRRKKKEDLI